MCSNKEKNGLLIVLPCHCVYDKNKRIIYSEHPEDRPIYEAHISYAIKHLEWRKEFNPILVISGGFSKKEIELSESRSYIDMAKDMGFSIEENIFLEEYSLLSLENLLFSLYVYYEIKKEYPTEIDVISWNFKKERFISTLKAINKWERFNESWEKLNFFPVGDLYKDSLKRAIRDENIYIKLLKNGIEFYYSNPVITELIKKRDVYNLREKTKQRYNNFPIPW